MTSRFAIAGVALLTAFGLLACDGGRLTETEACRLATEHLLESKDTGWQFHDAYHFPMVVYKSVEVTECFDFQSDTERGWAKISLRAMGDEHVAEDGTPRGRKEFTPAFEFDRFDQGWMIVK
jgi:hypothetical protein